MLSTVLNTAHSGLYSLSAHFHSPPHATLPGRWLRMLCAWCSCSTSLLICWPRRERKRW